MTVEAPKAAIDLRSKSLVIRGTVTDISAGTKQKEQAARFPNGVPAVSDESQERMDGIRLHAEATPNRRYWCYLSL